jgi:hypothetical protein
MKRRIRKEPSQQPCTMHETRMAAKVDIIVAGSKISGPQSDRLRMKAGFSTSWLQNCISDPWGRWPALWRVLSFDHSRIHERCGPATSFSQQNVNTEAPASCFRTVSSKAGASPRFSRRNSRSKEYGRAKGSEPKPISWAFCFLLYFLFGLLRNVVRGAVCGVSGSLLQKRRRARRGEGA